MAIHEHPESSNLPSPVRHGDHPEPGSRNDPSRGAVGSHTRYGAGESQESHRDDEVTYAEVVPSHVPTATMIYALAALARVVSRGSVSPRSCGCRRS
jgi:hypothetical protein